MLCRLRDGILLFAAPVRLRTKCYEDNCQLADLEGLPGQIMVVSDHGDLGFLSQEDFDRKFEPIPAGYVLGKPNPLLPTDREHVDGPKPEPAQGVAAPIDPLLAEVNRTALEALRDTTFERLRDNPAYKEAVEGAPIEIQNPIQLGVPYPALPAAEPQVSLLQRVREALAGTKVGFTRQELQEALGLKGGRAGKVSMSLSYLKKHGDVFFVPETSRWSLTNQGRLAERNRRLGEKEGAAA